MVGGQGAGLVATPGAAEVTVVIVTYNSTRHIGACLASLPPGMPAVILDNASADDTADRLAGDLRITRLIRSDANLGFARGVNRAATGVATPFILLLNPDARLDPGAAETLLATLKADPRLGLAGAMCLSEAGEVEWTSGFGMPTLWSMVSAALGLRSLFPDSRAFDPQSLRHQLEASGGALVPAGIVPGACMMIRRDLWQRLGGFDPRFFMYGEDTDLCIRIRRAGYQTVIVPGATFRHAIGGSAGTTARMLCQLMTGGMTILRLHGTPAERLFGPAVLRLHILIRILAARLRGKKTPWAEVWSRRADWSAGYAAASAAAPADAGAAGRIT